MKITDVNVQAIDVGQGFCWGNRRDMQVIGVLVTLHSDTGHVGHGLAWTADLPAASVISAINIGVKPHLLGGDPFNRHQLLAPVWRGFRVGTPLPAIGVVDVALWDLAGKACGRSVTEMLGRRHDRLKGSTDHMGNAHFKIVNHIDQVKHRFAIGSYYDKVRISFFAIR